MTYETLYSVLYLQINLFAVVLLLMIRFKTLGLSKMVAQRIFSTTLDSMMVFFASDTIWVLVEEHFIPHTDVLCMASKDIYFLSTAVVCYFWFVYFEYLQESPFAKNRKRMWLSSCFIWIQAILIFVNHFTKMLYYVDADEVYHRGPLFLLLYLFSYIYIFFTCLRAFIGLFKKDQKHKRPLLIRLALFPLAPATGGIIQFLVPRIPVVSSTLALATLLMYMDSVEEMVSVDPLTRLNNRKSVTFHYEQLTKNNEDHIPIYLLLIDANYFKGINDTYGHMEGDAALIRIADAMRKACGILKRRANIARFGGDEFLIMVKEESTDKIQALKEEIARKLAELNKAAEAPYDLTVSIGVAHTDGRTPVSLKDLAQKADENLYEQKKLRDKKKD